MTQTFNEDILIDGASDAVQLTIQGATTQTLPLQSWTDYLGNPLGRLTAEGKFQIGDLGLSAPAALIESSAALSSTSSKPKRGFQGTGRLTGAVSAPVTWAVHELEFTGSGGISSVHSAVRGKVTNDNTGFSAAAEFRGGEFQAVNQRGMITNRTEKVVGVRAVVTGSTGSWTNRAIAFEAAIVNDSTGNIFSATGLEIAVPANAGTIGAVYGVRIPDLTQGGSNYAIFTGKGKLRFGDYMEVAIQPTRPLTVAPPNHILLYPKILGGVPTLFSVDSTGLERIIGGGALNPPLNIYGTTDVTQFFVQGAPDQTADLIAFDRSDGFRLGTFKPSGSWHVRGASDDIRFLITGSNTQTSDLLKIETSTGDPVYVITGTGLIRQYGRADEPTTIIRGTASQTADLQQWRDSNNGIVANVTPQGKIRVNALQVSSGSGAVGQYLRSDINGNATWQSISLPLTLNGTSNDLQFLIRGSSAQTSDLIALNTFSSFRLGTFTASGGWRISGVTDDFRLLLRTSPTQTFDIFKIETSSSQPVHVIAASGATSILGITNAELLTVKGAAGQTDDLVVLRDPDNNALARLRSSGALSIWGATDDIRLFARASATQTSEMVRLNNFANDVLFSIEGQGATRIFGRQNVVTFRVTGNQAQTEDLQQWISGAGDQVANMSPAGKLRVNALQISDGASNGYFLRSDSSGNASWQPMQSTSVPLILTGTSNQIQLVVKGAGNQTSDIFAVERSDGFRLATLTASGGWRIRGLTDDIRLLVTASSTQTNDLMKIETSTGAPIHVVAASGATSIEGQSDAELLSIRSVSAQTTDLIVIRHPENGDIGRFKAGGGLYVWGISDNIRFFARGSATQTQDMLRLDQSDNSPLFWVGSHGATRIFGKADEVTFSVRGSVDQVSDLQHWLDGNGGVVAEMSPSGRLRLNSLRIPTDAINGYYLRSDNAGNASWQPITAPLSLEGSTDTIQLYMKGATGQGSDLVVIDRVDNFRLGTFTASGGWRIRGSTDDFRLLLTASETQNFDLLKIETHNGEGIFVISGSGSTILSGRSNTTQFTVKGAPGQTSDLQQWQSNTGAVQASLDAAGKLTISALQIPTGAQNGRVLQSDNSGNATWQPLPVGSGTVTSIGISTPSFLTVANSPVTTSGTIALGLASQTANRVFAGPASGGNAAPTFRQLVSADISPILAAPPAIGGTTPAAGTFTTLTANTSVGATLSDSGTTTAPNVALFRHNSSGTPAANFGVGMLLTAKSSTTNDRSQGRLRSQWVTATDASRQARVIISVFDTAERDALAVQASGSAPMIGFLGATPVVRQTGGAATAAATYGTNEQTMLQAVYNAMRTYGLLT